MATKKIHVCPKCGGKEFNTRVVVAQNWKVDQHGNFLAENESCSEVLNGPSNDNVWVCAKCGTDAIIADAVEDENEENENCQWRLLDRDTLFIERQLARGVFEYYRGIAVDPFESQWRVGLAVIVIDVPDADYDHSEAAIRADATKKSREQFMHKVNEGKAFANGDATDRISCMNRIIELSSICGDDSFLKFMLLHHEYDTERYRYLYVDDPAADAFFIHSDTRVAVLPKGEKIVYGVADGEELTERFETVHICSTCGAPMESGYTDGDDCWCCDEEFSDAMDDMYGKGNWRQVSVPDSEYCYEYRDSRGAWKPDDSYWTQWE